MTEFIYDISQKLSKAGEVDLDPMPWVADVCMATKLKRTCPRAESYAYTRYSPSRDSKLVPV